jgi:hypothetical protein
VDHIIPSVPIRQRVISVPQRLRDFLAGLVSVACKATARAHRPFAEPKTIAEVPLNVLSCSVAFYVTAG